ncbi:MAG: hypothetical protein ACLSGN_07870 [Oscillospiraceae bacterium]
MNITFKGKTPEEYGLKIISMSPPVRAGNETETQTIPGRAEPLNRELPEYANTKIEIEFLVTDISKIRAAFAWLKGQGKLIYSSEPDKYYSVISNDVIDTSYISEELRGFTVKLICAPFAYAVTNTSVTFTDLITTNAVTETTVTLANNGSIYSEPLYKIKFNGKLTVRIGGTAMTVTSPGEYTTRQFLREDLWVYLAEQMEIYIDAHARIAYKYENGVKKILCDRTSGQYPLLDTGDNTIHISVAPKSETWEHDVEVDGDTVTRTYCYSDQRVNELTITKNERWL